MGSRQRKSSIADRHRIVKAGLLLCGLAFSAGVPGQTEPVDLTAATCEVQVGAFESKCSTRIELLDNKQISVLFVTVTSVPEEHEISFYTEHVGMLVIGVDDGMMVTTGNCRNNSRRLRCRSSDGGAVLEIEWPR